MSEYQEALSRLNMPERTPGVSISRSQFPIARKDTPQNYHRILLETLNSPLPKYSIPQRLFIREDGSMSYTFPLDKQFTLAKGGRKTIAIREVNLDINTDLTPLYGIRVNDNLILSIIGDVNFSSINDPILDNGDFNINVQNHPVTIQREHPIEKFYLSLFNQISTQINNVFNTELNTQGVNYVTLVDSTDGITFKIYSADYLLLLDNFSITIRNGNDNNNINQQFSFLGIIGTETKSFSFDENTNTFTCKFPNAFTYPYSVCSTINPWSPGNIISSPKRIYSQLNKLFPYDNQQEIKLWFLNDYGNRIYNYCLSGYIDLELIIDNLNNFVMDD